MNAGILMHRAALLFVIAACTALCACANNSHASATAPPSVPPTSAQPVPATAFASSAAASSNSAPPSTASSSPTTDPNLLAVSNGTIVRAFPVKVDTPAGAGDVTQTWSLEDSTPPSPYVFTFELPGVAKIDHFAIHPSNDIPDEGATVALATSTSGLEDSAFSNVSTVALKPGASDPTTLAGNVSARWVRMTIQVNGANRTRQIVSHLEAFGTLASRPPQPIEGIYRELKSPYKDAATQFDASFTPDSPPFALTQAGGSVNAQICDHSIGWPNPGAGTFDGRVYTVLSADSPRRWVANDESSMFVGLEDGVPIQLVRSSEVPDACRAVHSGNGNHNVVVIDSPFRADLYPLVDDQNVSLPPYRFTRIQAAWLTASVLASTDTVILNMLCDARDFLDSGQKQAMLDWIKQGNKLIIHDSDKCIGTTTYDFLPYPFTTNNPGPIGARGKVFVLLESDTLGSGDRTDRGHFLDTDAYLSGEQEIGDANIVTTQDPHWCGHLFGSNVNNVNGFMQMYARYGNGLIIYDGLDHDDASEAGYQRIVKLELDQKAAGDLPCTRPAAGSMVLIPDQSLKFAAGQAQRLHAAMQLYANQVWRGHVTMAVSGELHADVTPASFDLSGGSKTLRIAIDIPSTTRPGTYPILVSANAAGSQPAQATVTVAAAMASALATQKRVRIYGIHFDYNSAHIQPQSEPVIAQIAGVMRANPSLRFRIEGYTDSDGGFTYNMNLSQRRAESVVNDLVARYHVARSRLVPRGYGMTNPVASNATDAGKALNRRVELVRI